MDYHQFKFYKIFIIMLKNITEMLRQTLPYCFKFSIISINAGMFFQFILHILHGLTCHFSCSTPSFFSLYISHLNRRLFTFPASVNLLQVSFSTGSQFASKYWHFLVRVYAILLTLGLVQCLQWTLLREGMNCIFCFNNAKKGKNDYFTM